MIELTYSELKQGLLCCTVYKDCAHCPLYTYEDFVPEAGCTYALMSAAMNCINTMERDLIAIDTLVSRWKDTGVWQEQNLNTLPNSFDERENK